jgi:hypothetical protein
MSAISAGTEIDSVTVTSTVRFCRLISFDCEKVAEAVQSNSPKAIVSFDRIAVSIEIVVENLNSSQPTPFCMITMRGLTIQMFAAKRKSIQTSNHRRRSLVRAKRRIRRVLHIFARHSFHARKYFIRRKKSAEIHLLPRQI